MWKEGKRNRVGRKPAAFDRTTLHSWTLAVEYFFVQELKEHSLVDFA